MGREGPGYISPDVQRQAIQRWADYRGVTIDEWHFDEDESGGTQNRPGLREAMRRIEGGETEGLACWRLNRFARNVSEALRDVERVHEAGGVLAFVEEDIDPTGPFGGFILTVLLAVAALELNNIKASWRTAKERAMERGAAIGPTPFGYRRRDDATLEADPVFGPVVTEAFRRAARESLESATAYLVQEGHGRTWTISTVRRFLTKTSYLGTHRYGDLTTEVPQLVTRAVWEAAQPEPAKTRKAKATFPLSGFATCEGCGGPMVGARGGRPPRRMYRCGAGLPTSKRECPRPAGVTAELLEEHVRSALLEGLSRHPGYKGGQDLTGQLSDAEEALEAAEAELADLTADLGLRRALGAERFRAMVEAAVAEAEAAQATYREAARAVEGQRSVVPAAEVLAAAEVEELGPLLRGALDAVVVTKGRGPLGVRVRIVPKGAPAEARLTVAE